MKRKNLLVVPAGHKSLHYDWIEKQRSYDIFIINYELDEIPSCGEEFRIKAKGKKWELVSSVLHDDNFLSEYQYIAVFDDDMRFVKGGLNQLFDLGESLELDLFQPSIDPVAGHQTPWIHLLNVKKSDYRWTNLIELMVPILTPKLLIQSRVAYNNNPIGWGLDNCYWPTLIKKSNGTMKAAVLDQVIMVHTREPLKGYDTFSATLDMHAMIDNLKLRESKDFVFIRDSFHPALEISEPKEIVD